MSSLGDGGRKVAEFGPNLSDQNDCWPVQSQRCHRCSANRSSPDHPPRLGPSKMSLPRIPVRVKERRQGFRLRISSERSRSFSQGTGHTGQSEICQSRRSAVRAGVDMIDVKGRFLRPLGQTAVLAIVAGSRTNQSRERSRNPLFHILRIAACRDARAFNSDNISTNSVSAVASRRSRGSNFPSRSWRSSNS